MERIGSRADKAEANGRDVSSVRTLITEATGAINAARQAIQEQSGKTYIIAVNTEEFLKTDVGRTRQALHTDLVKVRQVVFAARDAVRKAAVALGSNSQC